MNQLGQSLVNYVVNLNVQSSVQPVNQLAKALCFYERTIKLLVFLVPMLYITYPLLQCDLVQVISRARDGVIPPVVLGQLRDHAGEENLPVQHEAGHVDLHGELVPPLRDPVDRVQSGVLLLLWGVGVLADVLEGVLRSLADPVAMFFLVALRYDHLDGQKEGDIDIITRQKEVFKDVLWM